MWYNTNNAYTRRIVTFFAIMMVASQFQGSLKAIEPLWSVLDEQGYLLDPQPIEYIRKQTTNGLAERQPLNIARAGPTQPAPQEKTLDITLDRATLRKAIKHGIAHESTQAPPQKEEQVPESGQSQKPLNVLILYPDDWRHDDIGGVAPVVRTPFLNQLARDGIRFTHNMVCSNAY